MTMAKNSLFNMGKVLELYLPFLEAFPPSLRLYTNAAVLGPGMVAGDFTEPTDGGYVTGGMLTADWTGPIDGVTCVHLQADTVTFVFDHDAGDQTIVGVWFWDPDDVEVLWAQAFDAPVVITVAGQPLSIIPRYEVGDLTVPCT